MAEMSVSADTPLVVHVMRTGEPPYPVAKILARDAMTFLEQSRNTGQWIIVTDEDNNPLGGTQTLEKWANALQIRHDAVYN